MYNTRIKNAGFYLGQLMRDAENLFDEEEDEWEGTCMDDELLKALSTLDEFWRDVWTLVYTYAPPLEIEYGKYSEQCVEVTILSENVMYDKLDALPNFSTNQIIWNYSIGAADAAGWGWSGDTQVIVYDIIADNMKQLCAAYYLEKKANYSVEITESWYTTQSMTWPQFWLMAVHGNNNLPTFEEDSVTGDIACLISTGNQSVYITQKHNSDSFYVVIYDTS